MDTDYSSVTADAGPGGEDWREKPNASRQDLIIDEDGYGISAIGGGREMRGCMCLAQ